MREDQTIIGALKDHVFLFLDVTESSAKELAESHGVQGFPTFLVMTANGDIINTWMGYGGPGPWTERLADVLADPVTVDERKARHESRPTCSDAVALGRMAFTRGEFKDAEAYFRQALSLDVAAAKEADVPIDLFRVTCWGAGGGHFTIEQCRAVTEEVLQAEDVKPQDAIEVTRTLVRAIGMAGEENVREALRMAYPVLANVQGDELKKQRQGFMIDYALIVEGDADKAAIVGRMHLLSEPQKAVVETAPLFSHKSRRGGSQ